jgi:hypothetical protein
MDQVAQLIGAVLILVAFVGAQLRRLTNDSVSYLVLNAVGSVLLAIVAIAGRDLGFTLLETTWGVVSTAGLLRCLRGGTSRN